MALLRTLTYFTLLTLLIGVGLIIAFQQIGASLSGWSVTVFAARDNENVHLIDTRTTLSIPLLPGMYRYTEPFFSPDRRFVVLRSGGSELRHLERGWTFNLETGGQVAWSPDSASLIYVQSGELQRVWVGENSAEQERIDIPLQRSFGRINRIMWSPDGSQIAIEGVYRFGGETVDYEIYTLTLDDSRILNISNDATVDDYSPVWSPDGRRLAFVSERHGNPELYMVDLQQGGMLRLTNSTARDSAPVWSPDGTQIAFVSYRNGTAGGGLYLLDVRDPFAPVLTGALALGVREDTLMWSPDGTQIAFVAIVDGNTGVYVVDADGGNLRLIADMRRLRQVEILP